MKKLLLITMNVVAIGAFAQSTTTLTTSKESIRPKKAKLWNLGITSTTSTSVKEADAYDSHSSSSLAVSFNYSLPKGFKAQSLVVANKNFKGDQKSSFSTAYVGLGGPSFYFFNSQVSLSGKGRVYLPVNSASRRDTTYRGRIYGGLNASAKLEKLGLKYVSLYFGTSLAKNFHEWEINRYGSQNTSYYATNTLTLSYMPFKKGGFTAYITNNTSWNYKGERKGDTYGLGQSFSWSLMKGLSGTIGHEIGGSTYGYTGDELDVSLFDKNKSSIYVSVGYVY